MARNLDSSTGLLATARHRKPSALQMIALRIATMNLIRGRLRFFVAIGGLWISIVLIAVQAAMCSAVLGQITTYIDHVGARIWILQKGTNDLVSASLVSREMEEMASTLPCVESASGVYIIYTTVTVSGERSAIYLVGFDPKNGRGGPWRASASLNNSEVPYQLSADGIILDSTFAKRFGLAIGDHVNVLGSRFRVCAVSEETSAIGSQYFFVTRDAIQKLLPGSDHAFTHVLLFLAPGCDVGAVVPQIRAAIPDADVFSASELAQSTRRFLGSFLIPFVTFGAIVALGIGAVVSCISMYNAVSGRAEEYACLLALGAPRSFILSVVVGESTIIATVAALAAFPSVHGLILLANHSIPSLSAHLSASTIGTAMVSVLVMALLSSITAIARLARVEPASVFRA